MSQPQKGVNWHVIAAFLVAYSVFMVGLNRIPVPTVDGAVRASMARHIVETNQWWPVVFNGEIFTDHPPLFVWLTAISQKIFGVTDFATNLVPRLFALLTVAMTALIATACGLGRGTALLSAVILCSTRDFVLSSVRGYIEPVLEFFIYAGLWFCVRNLRRPKFFLAIGAGICTWLAAYSKGPVALWPFLFFAFLLLRAPNNKLRSVTVYLAAFTACTVAWYFWVEKNQTWPYWQKYFFDQVLGSALHGRGGAQNFEPFYFLDILSKTYWPWLILLVACFGRMLFGLTQSTPPHSPDPAIHSDRFARIFGIFGLGFVAGFSLMKWKFWYYIAPAYPAFALLIATNLHDFIWKILESRFFAKAICFFAAGWIIANVIFPIPLHHERVPEVMAFKNAILHSSVEGPVWFVENARDHNMVGTSGYWYFKRPVIKVTDVNAWLSQLKDKPTWVITSPEFWQRCQEVWCKKSLKLQTADQSVLVYYLGNEYRQQ